MTKFGKVLVYLNVFVAVLLVAWALSLYVNRTDWFDRTDGDTKIVGQLTQMNAEVTRLTESIKAAQAGYGRVADSAVKYEGERDFRSAVFAKRLENVKKTDDTVTFHIQDRAARGSRDLPGLIAVRTEGPAVTNLAGKPLQGLDFLRSKLTRLVAEQATLGSKILEHRAAFASTSDRIDAVQAESFKQKTIRRNLRDEEEFLADVRVNWEEQLRTLEIRKSQLMIAIKANGATAGK